MKRLTALLLIPVLLLSLTACGGSSKNTAIREEAAAEAPMEMLAADSATSLKGAGNSASNAIPENRKWIITVDMEVETDDLETLQDRLDEKISALNGYVEDQNVHNGSNYASRRYRYANMTVRIPAEKVQAFTEGVEGLSNVVSNSLRREDVTLSYVATESRVKALETEEARLLELMEKAETMADLLEIEARLTDVRYELENRASQLRTYDNQIDFATINLHIEEVQEYTPVEEPTLSERIKEGFSDSIEGLVESLKDLLVFLVTASPFLVVYGGFGLVIWLVIRKVTKKKPVKSHPKPEEKKNAD